MRQRSVVMILIVINILVFVLQTVYKPFTPMFILKPDAFLRPWILITHMFLHGSPIHIFYNMWGLLIFGGILEQRIGQKKFLLVYLASGLLAGIAGTFLYNGALGASAAVMGVLGCLIVLMPNLRVLFFFMIPMPLWVAGIVWAGMDIFGVFYPSGVANMAHLIGIATGIGLGFYFKRMKGKVYKRFSKKSHLDDSDIEYYFNHGMV